MRDVTPAIRRGEVADAAARATRAARPRSGVYAATITLPQGSASGTWHAQLDLRDSVGNSQTLSAEALDTATAEQVTIDRQWQLGTATTTATFPAGTVVTRQDGGRFAFYEMAAQPFTFDCSLPTTDLDGTPLATLQLGIPGLGLSFSQPVTISLRIGDAYNGYRLSIQSLGEGGAFGRTRPHVT